MKPHYPPVSFPDISAWLEVLNPGEVAAAELVKAMTVEVRKRWRLQ